MQSDQQEQPQPLSLASVAASLAFVGFVVQGGSYIVARAYYQEFDIEALELGISPLNAALKMTDTALLLLIGALTGLIVFATVRMAIRERLIGRHRLRVEFDRLSVFTASAVAVIALVVFLSEEARDSARSTIEQVTEDGNGSTLLAESDYRAAPVSIRWLEPEKEPLAFIFYPSPARVRVGLYLGLSNDLYYVYLPEEKTLARVSPGDVVMESFLGDELPPLPLPTPSIATETTAESPPN